MLAVPFQKVHDICLPRKIYQRERFQTFLTLQAILLGSLVTKPARSVCTALQPIAINHSYLACCKVHLAVVVLTLKKPEMTPLQRNLQPNHAQTCNQQPSMSCLLGCVYGDSAVC